MSIMPPIRPEDHSRDAETRMLVELLEALQEDRAIDERFQSPLKHLLGIFTDAARPSDYSGRRQGIVKWFGEDEADQIISSFHAFLLSYWHRSIEAKAWLPFPDFFNLLEIPKAEAVAIVEKLIKAIDENHEGFVLWPPPRTEPCWGP